MTEQIKSRLDEIDADKFYISSIEIQWLISQLRASLEREAIMREALEGLNLQIKRLAKLKLQDYEEIAEEALSRICKLGEPEKEPKE